MAGCATGPQPMSRGYANGRKPTARKPLASLTTPGKNVLMTRAQIECAVARGVPFTLRMADGKEHPVPHRDYISVSPKASHVIVWDDAGHFTVLPLLNDDGAALGHDGGRRQRRIEAFGPLLLLPSGLNGQAARRGADTGSQSKGSRESTGLGACSPVRCQRCRRSS